MDRTTPRVAARPTASVDRSAERPVQQPTIGPAPKNGANPTDAKTAGNNPNLQPLKDDDKARLETLGKSDASLGPLVDRLRGRPLHTKETLAADVDAWLKRLDGPADADAGRRVFFHPRLTHLQDRILLQLVFDALLQGHHGELEDLHRLDHARRQLHSLVDPHVLPGINPHVQRPPTVATVLQRPLPEPSRRIGLRRQTLLCPLSEPLEKSAIQPAYSTEVRGLG